MTPLNVIHDSLGDVASKTPGSPFRIVMFHGESRSVYNVIDPRAPQSEQPYVAASFLYRAEAEEWSPRQRGSQRATINCAGR